MTIFFFIIYIEKRKIVKEDEINKKNGSGVPRPKKITLTPFLLLTKINVGTVINTYIYITSSIYFYLFNINLAHL